MAKKQRNGHKKDAPSPVKKKTIVEKVDGRLRKFIECECGDRFDKNKDFTSSANHVCEPDKLKALKTAKKERKELEKAAKRGWEQEDQD